MDHLPPVAADSVPGLIAVIDALCDALAAAGLNPLPVYVTSLKEPVAAELLRDLCAHWTDRYDWRAAARVLNRYPQFIVDDISSA